MKFKVYSKILTTFLVIFLIFVLTFFYYLNSVESGIVINAGNTLTQGLLVSLEKELMLKCLIKYILKIM